MSIFTKPDGIVFCTRDWVDAIDLSVELCKVVSSLQALDPYVRLRRYDDWWEHDGLHFYRSAIEFQNLFPLVHSPRTLLESTPDDFLVFVGIAPENGEWYLRYRVEWDDNETNLIGQFAVVFPADRVELIQGLEEIAWLKRTTSSEYYAEKIL